MWTQPAVEFDYGNITTTVRASREFLYWFESLLSIPNTETWPPLVPFFRPYDSSLMTGHLPYIEQHLQSQNVPYVVHNRPQTPLLSEPDPRLLSTVHHPDFVLKPYQVSTTRKMLMGLRGGVQLATGAGKTASYIAALKYLEQLYGCEIPSLTVVTVTNLAKQMVHRMKNAGLNAGVYRSGRWGKASHVVAVVNGLYKAIESRNATVMRMLSNRTVFCLDEAHHGAAAMCYTVGALCNAPYRWMLSATLYANKKNPFAHPGDMRIMGISGPTLATIPARFLWEYGHVAKPEITFIPMHWPYAYKKYGERIGGRWVENSDWNTVEMELIAQNQYRNEFIRRMVYWTLAQEPWAKFVILIRRLEHGRLLQRMLARVGVNSACCFGGSKVVTVNEFGEQRQWKDQKDTVLNSFNEDRLRVLIGSQKFDEGQSFPMFTDLILGQAGRGGEANRRVYQRVGRGLHSGIPVRVRDFYDKTHHIPQRQAEERLMALDREDYPVRVDMPKECLWEIPQVGQISEISEL